jgi:hypothetical protein
MPISFRVASAIMAVFFGCAAGVQLNDPDPIPWIAVYGSACLLACFGGWGLRTPTIFSVALAVLALRWASQLAAQIDGRIRLSDLFQSWQMSGNRAELAREAGGLSIIVAWSLVVIVREVLRNRASPR